MSADPHASNAVLPGGSAAPLLEVIGLKTHFFLDDGVVRAVDGVDFEIYAGETVCVVGESGCGKSITARSIMGLVERPGRPVAGEIWWDPRSGSQISSIGGSASASDVPERLSLGRPRRPAAVKGGKRWAPEGRKQAAPNGPHWDDQGRLDLASLEPRSEEFRQIRGADISMIFQEPMASLSPMYTVSAHLVEAIRQHLPLSKQDAYEHGLSLLRRVGIPRADRRMDAYPFELSGGMCQRVMIAIALACSPKLLIADEPTTALDVTTQARIISLLSDLQDETGMAMMFITHDLGVVAEIADDVAVMYLGTVAEKGPVDAIFHDPRHPYTQALLGSIPQMGLGAKQRLSSIRGNVPSPTNRPGGCPFHTRCDKAITGLCDKIDPPEVVVGDRRRVRCVLEDPQTLAAYRMQEQDAASGTVSEQP